MTLPLYTIRPDGDAFQVCLVFKDDIYPIPHKRYTSHEVAKMVVKQMEKEDYQMWKESSLGKQSREYGPNGEVL